MKGLKKPGVRGRPHITEGREAYGKVSVDREKVNLADPHPTGPQFRNVVSGQPSDESACLVTWKPRPFSSVRR
jgi:hypothetical protein